MKKKPQFFIIKIFIVVILTVFLLVFFTSVKQIHSNSSVKLSIAQIAYFDSSIKQFYDKYQALPGDVSSTVDFGLSEQNSDGNNNGIIEDANGGIKSFSGEIAKSWFHLSNAGFIDEKYDGRENENAKIGRSFPRSKLDSDVGIIIFGSNGKNYFQIGIVKANNYNLIMSDNALKPKEAYEIDLKIDDGLPNSGRIVAVSGLLPNILSKDKKCISYASEYNIKSVTPTCQIRIEIYAR